MFSAFVCVVTPQSPCRGADSPPHGPQLYSILLMCRIQSTAKLALMLSTHTHIIQGFLKLLPAVGQTRSHMLGLPLFVNQEGVRGAITVAAAMCVGGGGAPG